MSRILLADDSAHAQRMGEMILREEGYEVVSVTDGETALIRLADVDPDVILADAFLPRRSGYEICALIKNHPRWRHTRVVLSAGVLEPLDEEEARRVGADGTVRKPFEASVLLELIKPLVEAAQKDRSLAVPEQAHEAWDWGREQEKLEAEPPAPVASPPEPGADAGSTPHGVSLPRVGETVRGEVDMELVRAAVVLALYEVFDELAERIVQRVQEGLKKQIEHPPAELR